MNKCAGSAYGNSVEAIGFQFGDICCANAVRLNTVNVYDECLSMVRLWS